MEDQSTDQQTDLRAHRLVTLPKKKQKVHTDRDRTEICNNDYLNKVSRDMSLIQCEHFRQEKETKPQTQITGWSFNIVFCRRF